MTDLLTDDCFRLQDPKVNLMKDNKGFSLVELIIVIAIMAVLVGVLAPLFIKYVEQSRRSRDIQTADQIREAFLADIAEGNLSDQLILSSRLYQ